MLSDDARLRGSERFKNCMRQHQDAVWMDVTHVALDSSLQILHFILILQYQWFFSNMLTMDVLNAKKVF